MLKETNDEKRGLEVRDLTFMNKGRGVFSNRKFERVAFVVEYAGDLCHEKEAKEREKIYADDSTKGCFSYYFKSGQIFVYILFVLYLILPNFSGVSYAVDATEETKRLGRLVNHSRTKANLLPKPEIVNGVPRICLYAKKNIDANVELLFDYGDRTQASLKANPFLKK